MSIHSLSPPFSHTITGTRHNYTSLAQIINMRLPSQRGVFCESGPPFQLLYVSQPLNAPVLPTMLPKQFQLQTHTPRRWPASRELGHRHGQSRAFTWARFLSLVKPRGASSPRPIRDCTHTHKVRGNKPRPLWSQSSLHRTKATQDFRAAARTPCTFPPYAPRAASVTPIP
jgi:hypothetical protein